MPGQEMAKTIIPTMNRIDRVTKHAVRVRERKDRAARRAKKPELATVAAARQDALIEALTRAHCVKYERKDWNLIGRQGLVEAAPKSNAKEMAARKLLARYEPGILDSLFGLGKDRRRELAERVMSAMKADQQAYEKAVKAAAAHNVDVNAAPGVMALDMNAIEVTLKANIDAQTIGVALEGFAVLQASPGRFIVFIDGLEFDAMPDETCVLAPDGTAAYLPLPEANIQEMHLSNICSASLRVGMEVLGGIGVDAVEVVARCHLPKGGGQTEQYPVLYVKLPHAALAKMDFRKLEPVSTVTALGGRLDWDSTRGLAPIGIDDLKLYAQAPPAPPPPQAVAS